MTSGIRNELKSVIRDVIWNEDKEEVLTEEKINDLTEFYTCLIIDLATKYIAGQKEHGGNLSDRDCAKELYKEILDMAHYAHEVLKKNAVPPSSVS
jgi:hypothetical protein